MPTASNHHARCAICHTTYAGGERFCPLDGGVVVATAHAADPMVGKTIDDRYFVRRLIGRGGMGAVYEADHVGLDKRVAIKFLIAHDGDPDALARFRREARAASRVSHENIVQIFDVGSHGGDPFIVMEYVEGRDVREVLKATGPMAPERVIAIGRQLLLGLDAIHRGGIVHRDIKPANILLTESRDRGEVVKIMDFGISKSIADQVTETLTGTGQVVGTPQYMAPEQIMGIEVDHRADLYSVGITLFAMCVGDVPFVEKTFTKLALHHMVDTPPSLTSLRADLPPVLVDAVARALKKLPEERFADAREFAIALGERPSSPNLVVASARPSIQAAPAGEGAPLADAPRTVAMRSGSQQQAAPTVPDVATTPSPSRRPYLLVLAAVSLGIAGGGAAIAVRHLRADSPSFVATVDAGGGTVAVSAPIDAGHGVIAVIAPSVDAGSAASQGGAAAIPPSGDAGGNSTPRVANSDLEDPFKPASTAQRTPHPSTAAVHPRTGSNPTPVIGEPEPGTASGRVTIDSTPPGATVIIDGQSFGVTPFAVPHLPLGRRAIRLVLAGYNPLETTADLAPDQRASIYKHLVPSSPSSSSSSTVDHHHNPYKPNPY